MVLLRRTWPTPAGPTSPEFLTRSILVGLRFAAASPTIYVVALRSAVFGIASSALPALMQLIARYVLNGNPLNLRLMLGAFGFGAVLSGPARAHMQRRWSGEKIVSRACMLTACAALLTCISRSMALILPAMAMAGAGWLLVLSAFNVPLQLTTPRDGCTRPVALSNGNPWRTGAKQLILGLNDDQFGAPAAIGICAGAMVCVASAGLRWPLYDDHR